MTKHGEWLLFAASLRIAREEHTAGELPRDGYLEMVYVIGEMVSRRRVCVLAANGVGDSG